MKATCKHLQLLQLWNITNVRKLHRDELLKNLCLDVTPLTDWQILKVKSQMEEQVVLKTFVRKSIQHKKLLTKGFIIDWTVLKMLFLPSLTTVCKILPCVLYNWEHERSGPGSFLVRHYKEQESLFVTI